MKHPSLIEPLERRLFMDVKLGTNLILNGDAESGTGTTNGAPLDSIPGWTYVEATRKSSVFKYQPTAGAILTTSPGPGARGDNFFYGGNPGVTVSIAQAITLSELQTDIDAGHIQFTLSGWFGGVLTDDDKASMSVQFYNDENKLLSQALVGGFTPEDRDNDRALLFDTSSGTVSPGTRRALVAVTFENLEGPANDGCADNLVLKLSSTLGKVGNIAGTIINDGNGDGIKQLGEKGLGSVKVFADLNTDGKLQATEPNTSTNSAGRYTLGNVPPGTKLLRVVVPSGFRATSTNPANVPVVAGLTSSQNPLLSQTGVISGVAFVDENGNAKQDTSEASLVGAIVYLDFNNNGQQDEFELTAKTNTKGGYKFNVHHGKYIVRLAAPTGFKTTSPSPSLTWTLKLAKGGLLKSINFGVQRI